MSDGDHFGAKGEYERFRAGRPESRDKDARIVELEAEVEQLRGILVDETDPPDLLVRATEVERLREVIRQSLRIECTAECRAAALTVPAKEKP